MGVTLEGDWKGGACESQLSVCTLHPSVFNARAAVAKYYRLGGLNNRNTLFRNSGGKIKATEGSVPSAG